MECGMHLDFIFYTKYNLTLFHCTSYQAFMIALLAADFFAVNWNSNRVMDLKRKLSFKDDITIIKIHH